ncbi:MAG: hypothetical protein WA865_03005 [Spirulinaceae cyanobacterium]
MKTIDKRLIPIFTGILLGLGGLGLFLGLNRDHSSISTAPNGKENDPKTSEVQTPQESQPSPFDLDSLPTVPKKVTPSPSPSPSSSPSQVPSQSLDANAKSDDKAPLTIYIADNQCNSLVAQEISFSEDDSPVETAVGQVIDKMTGSDFAVAGYRVNIDPQSQVATIDLRRSPDSKRPFAALSSCEKFALFGSLEKTLVDNPRWNVQKVVFTEQGEEILL